MAAEIVDFLIEQGATFREEIIWADSDDELVDLTGYSARMQIRSEIESVGFLAELTTENGGIALGGVAGTIELYISDEDTAAMTAQKGAVYDLELEDSGGDVTRLIKGKIEIDREVTR